MRRRVLACRTLLTLGALAIPTLSSAQSSDALAGLRLPLVAGNCSVVVVNALSWGQKLRIDGRDVAAPWERSAGDTVTIRLSLGLRAGDALSVNRSGDPETWSPTQVVQPGPPEMNRSGCQQDVRADAPEDGRDVFSATFRVGALTESFAPQTEELVRAFRPTPGLDTADAGDTSLITNRVMLDFDAQAKVFESKGQSGWLRVRTFYGTQQALICTSAATEAAGTTNPGACDENGVPAPNQALRIARNANSAELYIGFRDGLVPGNFYLNCGSGNLFILGVGTKALDHNHCGVGLILRSTGFRGTYFEYGKGKSEVFAPDAATWSRHRFDALVTYSAGGLSGWRRGFQPVKLFFGVALDRGRGPDSLVTTFGVGVDFARVFGG